MNKPEATKPSFDGFTQDDWDEVCDNPELSAEELASFRPASDVLPPKLYGALARLGNERQADVVRLDPDVLEHFRATGPGWEARVNAALRTSMKAA